MTLLSELTRSLSAAMARSWREHAELGSMDRAELMATATILDLASEFCLAPHEDFEPGENVGFEELLRSAAYDLAVVRRASRRKQEEN